MKNGFHAAKIGVFRKSGLILSFLSLSHYFIIMITLTDFKALAFSLSEVTESPHFEKTSFRVKNKIFATYAAKDHIACLKLSLVDQSTFTTLGKTKVYSVPNKWGSKGWTYFELKYLDTEMMTDALTCAYCEVGPSSLSRLHHKSTIRE